MLEGSDVIAFVATADAEAALQFYGNVLGLRLIDRNPFACAFDAAGTQLRVTVVDEVSPRSYTVLGWRVDDISASVRDLERAGVTFLRYPGMEQDDQGVWLAPSGARIAWFEDPDRNVLSLTQF